MKVFQLDKRNLEYLEGGKSAVYSGKLGFRPTNFSTKLSIVFIVGPSWLQRIFHRLRG